MRPNNVPVAPPSEGGNSGEGRSHLVGSITVVGSHRSTVIVSLKLFRGGVYRDLIYSSGREHFILKSLQLFLNTNYPLSYFLVPTVSRWQEPTSSTKVRKIYFLSA